MTTNGAEKQRISSLIGITANHNILPLFTIFKGKKVPRDIEHLESDQLVLSANPNSWMTKESFLLWIQRVWRPYSMQFERCLLIMDLFRVHKTEKSCKP